MAIKRNNITIGVSGTQMTALREDLVNEFQSKRIRFNGVDGVLVTTALQQLFEMAGGRVNIVVSNALPSPTAPNTQYWVKNYDGQTTEDGRYIIMTDHLNNATYIGSSSTDFSDYYTKEQVDELLDDKQDALTSSDETSDLSDTSKFSVVDTTAKTNKRWALSTLWKWMKGKITEVYYPVGTVIFNTGTNPGTAFGGTWSLYATGTKALYLDATAETSISEELPNIKGNIDEWYMYCGTGSGSGALKNYSTRSTVYWGEHSGGPYGYGLSFDASRYNSVYKNNGKVRAEGITICAWKRTA